MSDSFATEEVEGGAQDGPAVNDIGMGVGAAGQAQAPPEQR